MIREELKMTGVGDPTSFFPDDHKFAMKVTKGGSCCANCRWISDDNGSCGNEYFQKWQLEVEGKKGDGTLPEAADSYCCDLWHPS